VTTAQAAGTSSRPVAGTGQPCWWYDDLASFGVAAREPLAGGPATGERLRYLRGAGEGRLRGVGQVVLYAGPAGRVEIAA